VVRLPGTWEYGGPAIQHGQQEIATLHIGSAEDPRLLADVEKRRRVKRVGVRRSNVAERCIGILPQLMIWPIGPRVPTGDATLVMTRRVISIVTSGYPKM